MGGLASRSRVVSFVRMPCAWWHGREDEMSACPHVSRVWCLVESMSAPGPAAAARVENRDVRSGRARATGAGARTRRARGACGRYQRFAPFGACRFDGSPRAPRLFVLISILTGRAADSDAPPPARTLESRLPKYPRLSRGHAGDATGAAPAAAKPRRPTGGERPAVLCTAGPTTLRNVARHAKSHTEPCDFRRPSIRFLPGYRISHRPSSIDRSPGAWPGACGGGGLCRRLGLSPSMTSMTTSSEPLSPQTTASKTLW